MKFMKIINTKKITSVKGIDMLI